MSIKLTLPRVTADTPEEQIHQLQSYIFQLVNELEYAFDQLEKRETDDGK